MISDRVTAENLNFTSSYGNGILDKEKYPISKRYVFVDGHADFTRLSLVAVFLAARWILRKNLNLHFFYVIVF